ncbi:phage holin [Staphylococcus epidermidis]|uniref:phage holin n=1 Tax=Staphylococcus epidermidis TaxID=1282 RepID=UPI00073576F2|nr:phage holin [Staphylococcus epidermidis]MCG1299787.1 phage holin [Staphylococcus epidermidis]MCG1456105.1 phage holin [Staphylococcus epidermidis]MCG1795929.1 phage holin [Staphylococcus epidermidis]MCG2200251.1 phage holin [Staphylococcus epidermidis]MCG2207044.1 phage holin [Staphylococcus epidermidis]
MKINWINRFKNGTTLTALVGAVLLFAKQVTEAFGIDISSQLETISSILGSIITILVALGVVTNPNTKGVSDAGIDFELNKPRNENTHPVQFKSESGAVEPEVFDTNEPFTDDSDEEEFEFDNGGGGAPDENTIPNQ